MQSSLRSRVTRTLFVLAVLTAQPVLAQLYQPGDLIMSDHGLARIVPGGWSVAIHGSTEFIHDVSATADGNLLFVDDTSVQILDPLGGVATIASGVGTALRGVAEDRDGSAIVCDEAAGLVLRVTPQGLVTPIASGLTAPHDVIVTLEGDYLVACTSAIVRIDASTGSTTTLASGIPQPLEAIAVAKDGRIAVVSPQELYAWLPPTGGMLTRTPYSLCGPIALTADFAGGFYMVQGNSMQSYSVHRVDLETGSYAYYGSTAARGAITKVSNLRGPATPTTGAGASFTLDLELPGRAGLGYLVGASTGVYPGIALGSDKRGSPLEPGTVLSATFGLDLTPFTSGWSGTLDAQGAASCFLDLTSLPAGALQGTSLYVQAIVIEATAPSGIADFTNPIALHF